jgi:hypothetical protein
MGTNSLLQIRGKNTPRLPYKAAALQHHGPPKTPISVSVVKEATGQALGYFYFEDEPGRRRIQGQLRAGKGMLAVARECSVGAGTVQRIARWFHGGKKSAPDMLPGLFSVGAFTGMPMLCRT